MRALLAFALAFVAAAGQGLSEDWPQWRGPSGNGISPDTAFPTQCATRSGSP